MLILMLLNSKTGYDDIDAELLYQNYVLVLYAIALF